MSNYDLVVIGAGSGGTRAARFAATLHDAKVTIVELPFGFVSSDTVGGAGGTCVIRGCVPKKLLVYASEFSEEFNVAKGFGWDLDSLAHDWKKLIQNKSAEIKRLNGAYMRLLKSAGVDCYEGKATLVDAKTIRIHLSSGEETTITGDTILLATGNKAVRLNIPGQEHCITSDEALAFDDLPPNSVIVIIGGGYIAVEFSGIFRGLGATVHLMYRKALPLRGFDEECRQRVAENLVHRGIYTHTECIPQRVDKNEDGTMTLTYSKTDGSSETIIANHIMFATGRKPYFKGLGLENVGIAIENGAVKVNEFSQTSVPNIYAIGDLTDRMTLTPVALLEAGAFVKTVFGKQPTSPDYTYVPSAVFCQPPLGTVGYSEEAAVATFQGDLDIYVADFRAMKYTIAGGFEKTLMKLIVHVATDKVVGVHMVGQQAAEILQGIAIALKAGATKRTFDSTVGIHPTSAEEFVTMRTPTRRISGTGTVIP